MDIGIWTGSTMDIYYDDVVMSHTATDYPIGPGRVLGLGATTDGTHVGSTDFVNELGGGIAAGDVSRIDEIPMTSTADSVRQAIASGTSYLEWRIADVATSATARGVSALLAYRSSSAVANAATTKLVRPGDTDAAAPVVMNGSMALTALSYRRTLIPPPTGGWVPSAINGLLWRTGYRTGAGGIPYWDALLVEAEYRE